MVKLQHSKDRYFITLPKSLIIARGWKKGQELFICFNERGSLEITDKYRRQ